MLRRKKKAQKLLIDFESSDRSIAMALAKNIRASVSGSFPMGVTVAAFPMPATMPGLTSATMAPSAWQPFEQVEVARDESGNMLTCFGCAHSIADEQWPGRPAGERPCFFCSRNVKREAAIIAHQQSGQCDEIYGRECAHPTHGVWYDGSRAKRVPLDNYITVDRHQPDTEVGPTQAQQNAEAELAALWRKRRNGS